MDMKLFTKEKAINHVVLLSINDILSNPDQPRTVFETEDLEKLAESIKYNGILQPLTVRLNSENKYELISGERRLKAAKLAGLAEVPCIILKTDSAQSAIFALIENIQRQDLNYFEEAIAINKLIEKWNITQEEASVKLGKAQSTIANKLRLLRFDEDQRVKIINHGLTERHARALLKLPNNRAVDKAIHYIAIKHLNVKQTESYIRDFLQQETKSAPKFIPVIKDVRIFFNTIDKAVKTMQKAGIMAKIHRDDDDKYIKYTVKIPHVVNK